MKAKLTKRLIDTTQRPATEKQDLFVWDTETKGLGVRFTASGGRIYVLQTRVKGRPRRFRIARHGELTLDQARKAVVKILADVDLGIDPTAERRGARNSPTVADLTERYMTEHAKPYKKPSSVAEDRRNIALHIIPALGTKRVSEVKREDITRLHNALKDKPTAANRVLALLSKMFNLAEDWGLRPDGNNPCRHVTKYREDRRERYLSELELAQLGRVLKSGRTETVRAKSDKKKEEKSTVKESPHVIAAIRLLLFTGARLREILKLRWDYVDFEHECIRLPDSKTGAKEIQLNSPALDVLRSLPRKGSPWVIRGAKNGQHLVNLEKPWRRVRATAKLDNVRLHDLRHSFASVAAGQGTTLPIIGRLLGHTQAQTTHRYAHLANDPIRRASASIGAELKAALEADHPKLRRVK